MYFDLSDLLLLTIFISLLVYWWRAQGVKQLAYAAVKKYCKEMDVQLLDEGVALRGFWFKRDDNGRLKIWRSYMFEFSSTGDERYQGKVVLLGLKVENIELAPHRLN